jgi:hypothetical protein
MASSEDFGDFLAIELSTEVYIHSSIQSEQLLELFSLNALFSQKQFSTSLFDYLK